MQQAYIDDHDLLSLLATYYEKMKHRGVKFHPASKIQSTHKNSQPKDIYHKLHQQMDSMAKHTRLTSEIIPHVIKY